MSVIKYVYKRYLIDAMSAMALGLFSSLIVGLILSQLGQISLLGFLKEYASVLSAASPVVGAAIGMSIAFGLKCPPLVMFSSAATGALGYQAGGPIGAYIAAVVGAECGRLLAGKTKVDIIVLPFVTIIAGGFIASVTGAPITAMMAALRNFLDAATKLQPIPMGIIVSTAFGLALTAPISSAALAAMIFTVQGEMPIGLALAAGAASAGCCAQMVGFAVASYKENGVEGLIAQGLGTSMLQISNIFKNPAILLPATVAGVVVGPLATTIFAMKNAGAAAGMGTSGLVGPIGSWAAMSSEGAAAALKILLVYVILPAIIAWGVNAFLRKRNVIRQGDMSLKS